MKEGFCVGVVTPAELQLLTWDIRLVQTYLLQLHELGMVGTPSRELVDNAKQRRNSILQKHEKAMQEFLNVVGATNELTSVPLLARSCRLVHVLNLQSRYATPLTDFDVDRMVWEAMKFIVDLTHFHLRFRMDITYSSWAAKFPGTIDKADSRLHPAPGRPGFLRLGDLVEIALLVPVATNRVLGRGRSARWALQTNYLARLYKPEDIVSGYFWLSMPIRTNLFTELMEEQFPGEVIEAPVGTIVPRAPDRTLVSQNLVWKGAVGLY